MDKKGQMAVIGGMIMLAMAVIVGLVLLQGSAQNIDPVVNTVAVNQNFTAPANGTAYYFTDYQSLTSVVMKNASTAVSITSGNYTITNNVVYNGNLAVKLIPSASTGYQAVSWNLSATGQRTGYADSSSRSVTQLIIILMALALAAVAVGYAVKSYNE